MTQRQTFDVSGMTCAACSARVEKTTSGVAGVEHAVVNLLKNSMEVEYDGNPATLAAISAAVEKAGYGAVPRVEAAAAAGAPSSPASPSAARENAAAKEAHRVVRVHHPLVLLIHGPHVWMALARFFPGS